MDGKLKTPECVFDNEGTRYEHRFAPFISVATPPFIPYKQFRVRIDLVDAKCWDRRWWAFLFADRDLVFGSDVSMPTAS